MVLLLLLVMTVRLKFRLLSANEHKNIQKEANNKQDVVMVSLLM